MWWCLTMPWHKWVRREPVSDISDKMTCSCGRQYGMNNSERIILPWEDVKPFYDAIDRINGDVKSLGEPNG